MFEQLVNVFVFSQTLLLPDMSFWIQWTKRFSKTPEMNGYAALFYTKLQQSEKSIFLIFDRFVNLFDFSQKVTSQIWYCEFNGDNG